MRLRWVSGSQWHSHLLLWKIAGGTSNKWEKKRVENEKISKRIASLLLAPLARVIYFISATGWSKMISVDNFSVGVCEEGNARASSETFNRCFSWCSSVRRSRLQFANEKPKFGSAIRWLLASSRLSAAFVRIFMESRIWTVRTRQSWNRDVFRHYRTFKNALNEQRCATAEREKKGRATGMRWDAALQQ